MYYATHVKNMEKIDKDSSKGYCSFLAFLGQLWCLTTIRPFFDRKSQLQTFLSLHVQCRNFDIFQLEEKSHLKYSQATKCWRQSWCRLSKGGREIECVCSCGCFMCVGVSKRQRKSVRERLCVKERECIKDIGV